MFGRFLFNVSDRLLIPIGQHIRRCFALVPLAVLALLKFVRSLIARLITYRQVLPLVMLWTQNKSIEKSQVSAIFVLQRFDGTRAVEKAVDLLRVLFAC